MKKVILLLIISMNSALLLSCVNNTKVSNKDAQIEELQKELDSLKQQVGQNQQVQQTQTINQQVPIQNYQSNTINIQNTNITIDQAKQIATSNAGLDVNTVAFTKTITDYDDGLLKWEIEFVVNTNKYECEVSATNGSVLEFKVESIYND